MEPVKLYDSELRVMEVIWEKEPITAKEISSILKDTIGWNKNTTYTIIKKLIDKNIVNRTEPNFLCTSMIQRTEIQSAETKNLIERLYSGSRKMFFASFLQNEKLTREEIAELKDLIEKSEEKKE